MAAAPPPAASSPRGLGLYRHEDGLFVPLNLTRGDARSGSARRVCEVEGGHTLHPLTPAPPPSDRQCPVAVGFPYVSVDPVLAMDAFDTLVAHAVTRAKAKLGFLYGPFLNEYILMVFWDVLNKFCLAMMKACCCVA